MDGGSKVLMKVDELLWWIYVGVKCLLVIVVYGMFDMNLRVL